MKGVEMKTPERDYTTIKSNIIHTETCPKCGRKGLRRHYPDESFDLIIHKSRLNGFLWDVIDSCIINPKKEK